MATTTPVSESHIEIGFRVRDNGRYIAQDGKLLRPLPTDLQDPAKLIELYRAIVRTRVFDEKCGALQRTGRLGTYGWSTGQEAVFVGAASAMRKDDVLVPSFREHGAYLWRGAEPRELFLYWGGDERGNSFANDSVDFPYSVPVASHSAHATGVALAFKLRKQPRAALAIFGDGATSKGDFYESINFAGVWKLPVVYVVNNNQWAISVPRKKQTASETIAQKAISVGIPGEIVDGNDVVAVHDVCTKALANARNGGGATLIEAVTYRLSDHTTADDAKRYRSDDEVKPHWDEEPIKRMRLYLTSIGKWTKDDEEHLIRDTKAEMDAAADAYLATPPQDISTIFDYTYATLPEDLRRQKEAALQ